MNGCNTVEYEMIVLTSAATGLVTVNTTLSPLQKVSLVAPVTSMTTKGVASVINVIELVLLVQALGSGLPATRGLSYMIASTE